jgi:hypothetical protein
LNWVMNVRLDDSLLFRWFVVSGWTTRCGRYAILRLLDNME